MGRLRRRGPAAAPLVVRRLGRSGGAQHRRVRRYEQRAARGRGDSHGRRHEVVDELFTRSTSRPRSRTSCRRTWSPSRGQQPPASARAPISSWRERSSGPGSSGCGHSRSSRRTRRSSGCSSPGGDGVDRGGRRHARSRADRPGGSRPNRPSQPGGGSASRGRRHRSRSSGRTSSTPLRTRSSSSRRWRGCCHCSRSSRSRSAPGWAATAPRNAPDRDHVPGRRRGRDRGRERRRGLRRRFTRFGDPERGAAGNAWDILSELLRTSYTWLVVVGVLFLVAAWLAGPGRRADAARRVLAPALRQGLGLRRARPARARLALHRPRGRLRPVSLRACVLRARRRVDRAHADADPARVPGGVRTRALRRHPRSGHRLVGGAARWGRRARSGSDLGRHRLASGGPRRPARPRRADRRGVRRRKTRVLAGG